MSKVILIIVGVIIAVIGILTLFPAMTIGLWLTIVLIGIGIISLILGFLDKGKNRTKETQLKENRQEVQKPRENRQEVQQPRENRQEVQQPREQSMQEDQNQNNQDRLLFK